MPRYVDELIAAEMPRAIEAIGISLRNITSLAVANNALGNSRVFIEYQTAIIEGVAAYGRTLRERLGQFDPKHSPVSAKDFDAAVASLDEFAAENLCEMVARKGHIAAIVLRTSRFFPEEDDDAEIRGAYDTANAQANEMLYRRADIADVVSAHSLALEKAPAIGFGRYIVSATSPFTRADLAHLNRDAPSVIHRLFPDAEALYAARGWSLFPRIDRVYVNELARAELGWTPRCDFRYVLDRLRAGEDFRSALARKVGVKGYHDKVFKEGPYPV